MRTGTTYQKAEGPALFTNSSCRQKGHAVVIGSSVAGLTAARVLSDEFEEVTVVERDLAPDPTEFRRGAPQTRHAHKLLPQGQKILEDLFPGLTKAMINQGAVAIEGRQDLAFVYNAGWQKGQARRDQVALSSTRPLLDATLYQRVAALDNVHFKTGFAVAGLLVDAAGRRAAGVQLLCRRCDKDGYELGADLVVDASGRHSKAPQWLQNLGYMPPEEWSVDSFGGYATRIYDRPPNFTADWQTLAIRPTPPAGTRGGLIVPIEGERWHVTLVGLAGDYPPRADDEFLEFARSLPTPEIYEAIKAAAPLTQPAGFRGTANRIRRYDHLPRYLEGFLVLGDAAYILNPVYAQGMTTAIIGSRTLAKSLAQQPAGDLDGLAQTFQSQLSRSLRPYWHGVTSHDWHWPATTITDNSEQIYLN